MRASGEDKALKDLRHFYVMKYTAARPLESELGLRMVWCHAKDCILEAFTLPEVQEVLPSFKHGKSCGTDGVSYELLDVLAQSEAAPLFLEFLNAVWTRKVPVPP